MMQLAEYGLIATALALVALALGSTLAWVIITQLFSFDWLPHTGTHDGVHYAMGWCATGVPMGTYLGHQTALRIVGDPASVTALDDRPFPTRPFYYGDPWFLRWAVWWLQYQDRRMLKE